MADKPEIISFNQFIQLNWDMFVPYELWLTEELTEYLVAKRDLEKAYTSIVIDLDRDEPIYGYREDNIYVRFNGRFYLPMEDRNVKKLNMTSEQWIELFKTWFKEQEIEVVIDESATDLIKFTALVPVLGMPEEAPPIEGEGEISEEGEESPEEGEEPPEEGEESPEGEESKETEKEGSKESEGPEGSEESEDMELKEFEEALGL